MRRSSDGVLPPEQGTRASLANIVWPLMQGKDKKQWPIPSNNPTKQTNSLCNFKHVNNEQVNATYYVHELLSHNLRQTCTCKCSGFRLFCSSIQMYSISIFHANQGSIINNSNTCVLFL